MSPVRILRRRALHLITRITGAAIMCVDGVAKDMPLTPLTEYANPKM